MGLTYVIDKFSPVNKLLSAKSSQEQNHRMTDDSVLFDTKSKEPVSFSLHGFSLKAY